MSSDRIKAFSKYADVINWTCQQQRASGELDSN